MDLEDLINEYKHQNLDPLGHWLAKLDENHKDLMQDLIRRFNLHLDNFKQNKTNEIQSKLDLHISNNAKKELLEKMHGAIINQNDFLSHYRNIINKLNNTIDNEFYPEFVMSFGVIGLTSQWIIEENELKAFEYLEEIATLNILENLIKCVDEDIVFGNPRFKEFPEWQMVLSKLANRFEYKFPTTKFSIIYLFMLEKKYKNQFKDDETFRKAVQDQHKDKLNGKLFSRINTKDEIKDLYTKHKERLTQIYNS